MTVVEHDDDRGRLGDDRLAGHDRERGVGHEPRASGVELLLPVTGNGPIWLAVAMAALLGGVALISRHSARR